MPAKPPQSQSQQTFCTAKVDDVPPQPTAAAPAAVDFQALATAQQSCPEMAAMSSSPSLQIVTRPAGDSQLLGDISTGTFRPLLPQSSAVFMRYIIQG